MAGDFMSEAEGKERGLNRYFNSYTLRGRFNWVVLTYSTLFGLIAYYKLRKKPKKSTVSKKGSQGSCKIKQDNSKNCGCRR
ncbi:hypothetical protein RRG08_020146 [Elysia crispata]|uniref:ATP synthase F0 subunit 8 n=1 Tax=Elysia crispata TaxID=231223 RepID=A0AAE1B115_9GAST|nr:hypothetical protein RRG08_020146 [Elysia crispata]